MTTTTRPPAPTTTQATGGNQVCDSAWACDEVNDGINNGYLPEDFNPQEPTQTIELVEIIEAYGEHNPDFDTESALQALTETDPDKEADRGDMFVAIAAGLDIDVDPNDPFEVADELADMGILQGHDRDGDGVANPYTEVDADPDSTMTNEQLAAFLDRIPIGDDNDNGGGEPPVHRPTNPPGGGGSNPDDEMCTTGLVLSGGERSLFLSQLRWATLVGIEAQGEPGAAWPPHPDVPGGSEFLVVSRSSVWPVVDQLAQWYVVRDDGCLWQAITVQTRVEQLLPWRSTDRRMIEDADAARPAAGFDVYLKRWDNLSANQQAQTQQLHRDRDVSESCRIETAAISLDSYNRCRWELPTPGVWSWQARACFEGIAEDTVFQECATLGRGVEWFLGILDYTSGITLQLHPDHDPGARAGSWRPAPAG